MQVLLALVMLAAGLGTGTGSTAQASAGLMQPAALGSTSGYRDFHLLTVDLGWVLVNNQLYWTSDGGTTWRLISSTIPGLTNIGAVDFIDANEGRVLIVSSGLADPVYSLARTHDGGVTWEEQKSGQILTGSDGVPAAAAFLDFVDAQTGWLSLKLQSGSSFSLGRLFLTEDGGRTWQERSLPLGEPAAFLDAQRGWVSGGPAGDLAYQTADGGRSWQPRTAPLPDSLAPKSNHALSSLSLPGLLEEAVAADFLTDQTGWIITLEGSCQGYKPPAGQAASPGAEPFLCMASSKLFMTSDGGNTWAEITPT